MRVCLVSREFVPFWGAGIGTYASQMAGAWQASGHEVHVVCPPHEGVRERGAGVRPGVSFHTLELEKGVCAWTAYRFSFLRHAMGVYQKLLELHERHAFEYIEFPEYWGEGYFALRARQTLGQFGGAVLGVRLHTPTQDCRALNQQAWLNEEIAWLDHAEEESMRLADVLISPSRSLLERVRARAGLGDGRGFIVPYAFDVAMAARELGIGADAARARGASTAEVLYFGRIEHRKGVHLLVEAGQRLLEEGVDARFRFVGRDTPSGRSGAGVLAHVRGMVLGKWRERFVFESARRREELGGLIRASSVCCFPSLWDNFPNACLEAMAVGGVVVGSDAGGMGEIIEDGRSGVLFRSGDVGALAEALRRALGDGELRARVSAAAPGRVAKLCAPDAVVRAMMDVIGSVGAEAGAGDDAHREVRAPGVPLVSFVVPHYNLGRYLREAIESIRRQTVGDYEIIIVDVGSTDAESAALIGEVEAGAMGEARVVREETGGLASARNAGVGAARGRWIVPLDADDALDSRFLERTLAGAARDPTLSVVTTLVCHFGERWGDLASGWIPLGLERDVLPYANCASYCTALIRREAIQDAGGYDAWMSPHEDWDLYCRLAARGYRAAVVPEFLIGSRHRPAAMLRSEDPMDQAKLRALMYARHGALSLRPERTLRLQLAEAQQNAELRARELVAENVRYRVADRINEALKRAKLQGRIKRLAQGRGRAEGAR